MSHLPTQPASRGFARILQFAICNLQFAIAVILFAPPAFSAPSGPLPTSDPVIRKAPAWQPPHVADIKAQAIAWLEKSAPNPAAKTKAAAVIAGIGEQATGTELLDRLAGTFAAADTRVAQLVETCSHPRTRAVLPVFAWLTDAKTPPLLAANMRLYFGRWLVQGQWFEEGLEQLNGLKPAEVAAPAELLFYQSVVYHRMLNKEEGMKSINLLLDGPDTSPRRYVAVAYLMQADLSALEPESLDHIARRMEDIQRRLDLGRGGPKVRKVEDGVVESLDKMIKKMEDEQNKNQSGANSLKSNRPADASTPALGKAPGDVAKKNIGNKSGWGDLPPKERDEALQQMGREFPSHYRDIIEQYFRKLATEENDEKK